MPDTARLIELFALSIPLLVGLLIFKFAPREDLDQYIGLDDIPKTRVFVPTRPKFEFRFTILWIVLGACLSGLLIGGLEKALFRIAAELRTGWVFEFHFAEDWQSLATASVPFGVLLGSFSSYFYARRRGTLYTRHWLIGPDGVTPKKRFKALQVLPTVGLVLGVALLGINLYSNHTYLRVSEQGVIEWSDRMSFKSNQQPITNIKCVRRFDSYTTHDPKRPKERKTYPRELIEFVFADGTGMNTMQITESKRIHSELWSELVSIASQLPLEIDFEADAGTKRIWVQPICRSSGGGTPWVNTKTETGNTALEQGRGLKSGGGLESR